MGVRLTLLARVCHLRAGDKFRLVNGDGTTLDVFVKVHDSLLISASCDFNRPFDFPKPTDYVELLSTSTTIYAVCELRESKPTIIGCHLTKAAAYKTLFKRRNDAWYRQRSTCVGDFYRTLNITLPKYAVTTLELAAGET